MKSNAVEAYHKLKAQLAFKKEPIKEQDRKDNIYVKNINITKHIRVKVR